MLSPRRMGSPDAKNRLKLLDAAEQLMLEHGHASLSSRRVAEQAGLKPPLVYYYFRTMDELFLELFRRRADEGLKYQASALDSPQPLRTLWAFSTDPAATAFTMEFISLARQSEEMRAEIASYSERFRAEQCAVVAQALDSYGVDCDLLTPMIVTVLMTSISRVVVMEDSLGVEGGHAEVFGLVESLLLRLEGPAQG